MELSIQFSEELNLLPNHIQESTSGRTRNGSGTLAMRNKTQYLTEELGAIVSDIRAVSSMMERQTQLFGKVLLDVLENHGNAEKLIDEMSEAELWQLKKAAVAILELCRDKLNKS